MADGERACAARQAAQHAPTLARLLGMLPWYRRLYLWLKEG